MAPSLNTAIIRDTVLEAALQLVSDPIPNIRFNVAKCLETLAAVLANDPDGQDLIQRRILPTLRQLQEDPDADVRYFATKAYERTTGDNQQEAMVVS